MRLIHGDCLEVMRTLEAGSVDAVVTDPPYFKVKDEEWDRQWESESSFLDWIGELCTEWYRLLKPNGSLFVFASPRMSAAAYPGKHPCEKPVALMQHIVTTSTLPGGVVLDCFMGSGSTGAACARSGRGFIGIEKDAEWFLKAQERLKRESGQGLLFDAEVSA